jgi:hypothetical protein
LKAILGIAEDVKIVFINQEHKVGNHRDNRSCSTKDSAQKQQHQAAALMTLMKLWKWRSFRK